MKKAELLYNFTRAIQQAGSLDEIYYIFLTTFTAASGLGYNRAFILEYKRSEHALIGKIGIGYKSVEKASEIWHGIQSQDLGFDDMITHFNDLHHENDDIHSFINEKKINLKESSCWQEVFTERSSRIYNYSEGYEYPNDSILKQLHPEHFAIYPIEYEHHCYGLLYVDNHVLKSVITPEDQEFADIFTSSGAFQLNILDLNKRLKEKIRTLKDLNIKMIESQNRISLLNNYYSFALFSRQLVEQIRVPIKNVTYHLGNLLLKTKDKTHKKELGKIASLINDVDGHVSELDQPTPDMDYQNKEHTNLSLLLFDIIDLCQDQLQNSNIVIECNTINHDILCHVNETSLTHLMLSLIPQLINHYLPPDNLQTQRHLKFHCELEGNKYAILKIESDKISDQALTGIDNLEFSNHQEFFDNNLKVTLNYCRYLLDYNNGKLEIKPDFNEKKLQVALRIPLGETKE